MKHIKWIVLFSASCLAISACGSKGGGSGTTSNKNSGATYYESDGQCYRARTNEKESSSKCSNLKYYIFDGECYDNNDKVVSLSKCTSNSFFLGRDGCYDRNGRTVDDLRCYEDGEPGGKSNSRTRVCSDDHMIWQKEGTQYIPYIVDCDGRKGGNCSGYVLYDLDAQEWADCQ